MCLLLVAHDCCAGYRLIVAANRDEFHARPTAPAAYWNDHGHIIGGRDLEAGGTWLACDTRGRFATLTNVRSGDPPRRNPRSRGLLINDYLLGAQPPRAFSTALAADAEDYDGFNLLTYAHGELYWYSNQVARPRALDEGIYTLSNALLDTAWPKTERLRAGFTEIIEQRPNAPVETLLGLLRDGQQAAHGDLPDTGVGHDMERVLSSIFIHGERYGTRCSTVILIDDNHHLTFHERRYDADARISGNTHVEFDVAPAPT